MSSKVQNKGEAKDRKQQNASSKRANDRNQSRLNDNQNGDSYRSTDLRDSPMMAYLLDALEKGQDIGHYGRLTFLMVAYHFLSEDEMVKLLEKQPGIDEKEARAQVAQIKARGYNPPKRERILQWMAQQDFPICPNPEDPNACNVYRDLQFPDGIYENIEDFWEEKAEADEEG